MKKTKFYVCQKCNNIINSSSEAEVFCCGDKLTSLSVNTLTDDHHFTLEQIENDYYITFDHPMTKEHYISCVSYVGFDRVLTIKLYPESDPSVRFPVMRGGKMYFYCTNHGLYEIKKII